MSVTNCCVVFLESDEPLNAFICLSNWTPWIMFHCLTSTVNNTPPTNTAPCIKTAIFSLNPHLWINIKHVGGFWKVCIGLDLAPEASSLSSLMNKQQVLLNAALLSELHMTQHSALHD